MLWLQIQSQRTTVRDSKLANNLENARDFIIIVFYPGAEMLWLVLRHQFHA